MLQGTGFLNPVVGEQSQARVAGLETKLQQVQIQTEVISIQMLVLLQLQSAPHQSSLCKMTLAQEGSSG